MNLYYKKEGLALPRETLKMILQAQAVFSGLTRCRDHGKRYSGLCQHLVLSKDKFALLAIARRFFHDRRDPQVVARSEALVFKPIFAHLDSVLSIAA